MQQKVCEKVLFYEGTERVAIGDKKRSRLPFTQSRGSGNCTIEVS